MFKQIQQSLCRYKALLAFIVFIFFINSICFSLTLTSSDIVLKKDPFSKYKPTKFDQVLHGFIKDCYYGNAGKKSSQCLSRAKDLYKNKDIHAYKNLIKESTLKLVLRSDTNLETLDFLSFDLFNHGDLKDILNSSKNSEKWLKNNYSRLEKPLKKLLTQKPNMICKVSDDLTLKKDIIKELPKNNNFFKLNFSNFPCGMKLPKAYDELLKEINELNLKNLKFPYKFAFSKKETSLTYYLKVKNYSSKKFWKSLFKASPSMQKRVLINHFYNRKYDKLSYLTNFSTSKIKKVHPRALEYVVKVLLYKLDHKGIEKVTAGLNYKPSEWAEEILFSKAASKMRQGKFAMALSDLDTMLLNVKDLRLTALYWKWVCLSELEDRSNEASIVQDLIIKDYPLTYYGLRLSYLKNGASFFKPFLSQDKVFSKKINLKKHQLNKLLVYYSGDFKVLFGLYFNSIKKELTVSERALFGLVLGNLGQHMLAMKVLNEVWDEDMSFVGPPFINTVFPTLFLDKIKTVTKKLNYVDSLMTLSLIRQESAFNKEAQSSSRAKGLMQVVEPTAREMVRVLRIKGYRRNRSLFDPMINLKIGTKYLDRLTYSSRGYIPYALASYNTGPGNMYRWSSFRAEIKEMRENFKKTPYKPINELWVEELPWSETRFYVKAVLRNLGIYAALQNKDLACEFYWMCAKKSNKDL